MKSVCWLLLALLCAAPALAAAQCPESPTAFEALFNVPGVTFDAAKLPVGAGVAKVASSAYAWRSGYDARFALVLSLQTIPGLPSPVPALRVQAVEGQAGVTDKDLRRVLTLELDRLCAESVLQGLNSSVKEKLVAAARLGLADWDRRLVWDKTGWKPFNESTLYTPPRGCQAPLVADYSSLPVWQAREQASQSTYVLLLLAVLAAAGALALARKKKASRPRAATSTATSSSAPLAGFYSHVAAGLALPEA